MISTTEALTKIKQLMEDLLKIYIWKEMSQKP